MTDVFTKRKRSQIMALIRSSNTEPEIILRKLISSAVYSSGLRYRINYDKLPGRPDIAFVSNKLAIFADGDFWHGYGFENKRKKLPKLYWRSKIRENIKRDKMVGRKLKNQGWKVVRFWEHDIKKNPEKILKKISNIFSNY